MSVPVGQGSHCGKGTLLGMATDSFLQGHLTLPTSQWGSQGWPTVLGSLGERIGGGRVPTQGAGGTAGICK